MRLRAPQERAQPGSQPDPHLQPRLLQAGRPPCSPAQKQRAQANKGVGESRPRPDSLCCGCVQALGTRQRPLL